MRPVSDITGPAALSAPVASADPLLCDRVPLPNGSPPRRSPTVVFVTANNPLPYDRRVWQEARFVRGLGASVIGVSPAGLGPERPSEPFVVVDGIPIHRFRMQEAE